MCKEGFIVFLNKKKNKILYSVKYPLILHIFSFL